MIKYKRIFIIGHPGAGKALLAKTLADKLGWQFVDADFGLEVKIGHELSEILGSQGEVKFHEYEYKILSTLLTQENIVVTTDASIVDGDRVWQLLADEFVVYLQVNTLVQLERTPRNPQPLLKTNFKEFLNKLHANRDHLYEQMAHLSISSDDSDLERHVALIIKELNANRVDQQVVLDQKDLILFHKRSHIPVNLSKQHAICIKLLAQGKSSKEIAKILNISHRTIEGYIAKAMDQLGCASSKELIGLYHDKP